MSRAGRRKEPSPEAGPPLSPLPPPRKSFQGIGRFALPLLLLCYLVFAAYHASLVPTGQTGFQNAPDEAAHVLYARKLAAGRLPTKESSASEPKGYEWHQPPLYYGLAALLLPLGEKAMRSASILCGLIGLLLIYRAARLLLPDEPIYALNAVGFSALLPTHIAITSTVNNDALLEVCFGWVLLLLFESLRSGFTLWRAGWLGLALGTALLTKATALLLLPIALLALLLFRRAGETPRSLLRGTGWTLTVMLAVCGWWLIRNGLLYGEPLPLRAFQESFTGTAQAGDMAAQLGGWSGYFLLVGQWTFQSFWAVYGTMQDAERGIPRFLEPRLYLLAGLLTLLSCLGLAVAHFRSKTDLNQTQRAMLWLLFATLGLVALSFFGFLLRYFQTQGRYLYPAMLPLSLLFALGWRYALPRRYAPLASGLLMALLAALCVAFLRYVSFATGS